MRKDIDDIIDARLARFGAATRADLLEARVPAHAIDDRVRRGRLQAIHRGVYIRHAAAGASERELLRAKLAAAVLAAGGRLGPGPSAAAVSHRRAAELWGLLPVTVDGDVHVLVERGRSASARGLVVHRVGAFVAGEVRRVEGIPVTSPARTLLDCAAAVSTRELEQALTAALRSARLRLVELQRLIARRPRRAGSRTLRRLIERYPDLVFTRSEAEAMFLELLRRAGLPEPEVNVVVAGFEVDALFRFANLVVEVDGRRFHSSAAAIERDRQREAALVRAGFRVIRLTWKQIVETPEATAVVIWAALYSRAA